MMASTDLRNPSRTIHAGVILMGGETELLDIAPIDFVHGMCSTFVKDMPEQIIPSHLKEQALDMKFHWLNETGKPARLSSGLSVNVTDTFTTCPPLDIALMGAHDFQYTPTENELAFIRETYQNCAAFLTVCGGFMAPLQAGILNGRRATAPRPMIPMLKQTAPQVDWTEKRWECDGKLWTSGALLNGTDMMGAFGKKIWGAQEADGSRVWLIMGLTWEPGRSVMLSIEMLTMLVSWGQMGPSEKASR